MRAPPDLVEPLKRSQEAATDAAAGITIEPVPVVIFGVVTGIAAVLVVVALLTSPRVSTR